MSEIYEIRIRLNNAQTAFICEEMKEDEGVCSKTWEHVPFTPALSEEFQDCD